MKNQRAIRIATPKAEATPLAERGRMLFVRDVVELLGGKKSAWWVRNRFAPEQKHRLGRDPYWWEKDALRWLDEQTGAAA
jgi:hypothetical protein